MKKQPKQQRSQTLVEAILGSATRILSQNKLNEVSTNAIADLAGVGIGSIYDYFPNKTAIVSALLDRRMATVLEDFRNLLLKNPEQELEEKIDEVVQYFNRDFLLGRIFFVRSICWLLRQEEWKVSSKLALKPSRLFRFICERRTSAFNRALEKKAFLTVNSVLGIVESYIMLDPSFLRLKRFHKVFETRCELSSWTKINKSPCQVLRSPTIYSKKE